jgi:hypothetical protein
VSLARSPTGASRQRSLRDVVDNEADAPSLLFLAATTTKRVLEMAVASTLLEQTEVLQGRLDRANAKHLGKSDPHNHNRMDGLRDGSETAIGGITFGASTTILTRQRQVAEHKFQSPFAQAGATLRQLHVLLSDGTATLDGSPAFQKSVPDIRAALVRAAAFVASAETEA